MAKCKNCVRLFKDYDEENQVVRGNWCDKIFSDPDVEEERECIWYKPMTNGDRIRRMTDEELSEIIFCPCDMNVVTCCDEECDTCVIRWLKGEHSEK